MVVRGRSGMMQGKDCLVSWKILLVKTISVNLMKIFWENFPSLWCREDNRTVDWTNKKQCPENKKHNLCPCSSFHLCLSYSFPHLFSDNLCFISQQPQSTPQKTPSLRNNSYFLAIPNPQPVKTILELNSRCVFSCWKTSLPSQASGQRATQLYNISLSIKQLGTKSSRWAGVWDGRTWRRSQKHQGTSTLSWAEQNRTGCVWDGIWGWWVTGTPTWTP